MLTCSSAVLQPLEQDMVSLAQQQICLQKMELFYESWWVPLPHWLSTRKCNVEDMLSYNDGI